MVINTILSMKQEVVLKTTEKNCTFPNQDLQQRAPIIGQVIGQVVTRGTPSLTEDEGQVPRAALGLLHYREFT